MKYVAFFRGINVGGKNIVKMADLRKLFYDCDFLEVKTYIQSGNVLFESELDQLIISDIISHAFVDRFGFQSLVVLRSVEEISQILESFPFSQEDLNLAEAANSEVEHVYVYLSNDSIDSASVEALNLAYTGEDRLIAGKREVYLLCYQSVRDSKLAASISKLTVSLTARNQNTLRKILALLS